VAVGISRILEGTHVSKSLIRALVFCVVLVGTTAPRVSYGVNASLTASPTEVIVGSGTMVSVFFNPDVADRGWVMAAEIATTGSATFDIAEVSTEVPQEWCTNPTKLSFATVLHQTCVTDVVGIGSYNIMNFTLTGDSIGDTVIVSTNATWMTYPSSAYYDYFSNAGEAIVTVTPEPAAYVLISFGLAAPPSCAGGTRGGRPGAG
jgi:hypothetical protein